MANGHPSPPHFLDLDDDGSAPLDTAVDEEYRNLGEPAKLAFCRERAAALKAAAASDGIEVTQDDVTRLGSSLALSDLQALRVGSSAAVITFGDPHDLNAPLRAAEALDASAAPVLILSGAFGGKGPHFLAEAIERRASEEKVAPWRHTHRWRKTRDPVPTTLPSARPMPLPPQTGDPAAVDVQEMCTAEPRTPRYLTEADCYLELLLGRLEELGYFGEDGPLGLITPADVSIERDS